MTERASATVAVVAGHGKRQLHDALFVLEGVLGRFDNLVVLGPRHGPGTASSWRELRGAKLSRPNGRPSVRDLVLVIDDQSLPSDGLLEALIKAMDDPTLGAVAPRCNIANGDELLCGVPYAGGDPTARRAVLHSWRETRPSTLTPADHLGGPCVLLRSSVVTASGGLDGLRDPTGLQRALEATRAKGLRMAVAENAYVHHLGGKLFFERGPWPLVSACLIVKDEEAQLASCLNAASHLADEVVVYDTGSRDGTVALARSLGAKVIEGFWDGDFARARNAALEVCKGQWILWVDADEILECRDPKALRDALSTAPDDQEGFLVLIDNLQGTEASTALTHPAVRLFRRAVCQWEGRLHEQVVRRFDKRTPRVSLLDAMRISHRGYLQQTLQERAKGTRNVRSAFEDLCDGSALDFGLRLLNLGRSYLLSGLYEEAADICESALVHAANPSTARLALRALGDAYSALCRHEEALEVASKLRRISKVHALADLIEGRARLDQKDYEGALRAFSRIDRVLVDDDGFEYRPGLTASSRAQALVALGRHGEAADVLLETLRAERGLDTHLGVLVEALESAGRDHLEILDAIGEDRLVAFVPQLVQLKPAVADRVLESWFAKAPNVPPILAAAANVAPRCTIDRQLVWSARLRQAGLPGSCPLIANSTHAGAQLRERVLSSAVAWVSFGDMRAQQAFVANALMLSKDARDALIEELNALAPPLVAVLNGLPEPRGNPPMPSRGDLSARVVVVGSTSSGLSALCIAISLANEGHDVCLLQPGTPELTASRFLLGVEVRAWSETEQPWTRSCLSTLAQMYATKRIDAVVLTGLASQLEQELRPLLPLAVVLADNSHNHTLEAHLTAGVVTLTQGLAPVPLAARAGLCVLADLRDASEERAERTAEIISALAEAHPDVVISHCGGDPNEHLVHAQPALVRLGPLDDPTPWIRSARVVLVVQGSDARAARLAAIKCGTPTVELEADPRASLRTIETLLRDDLAWQRTFHDVGTPTRTPGPLFSRRSSPCTHPTSTASNGRPLVCLTSPIGTLDSLAQVNRELLSHLAAADPSFDLFVATPEPLPLPSHVSDLLREVPVLTKSRRPAGALELRHQWPPDFRPPRPGELLVCIQPFEFGGLPAEWIGPLRDIVDELWVPTSWVRQCAIDSGVPAEKVTVVPNGVDTGRFRPDGPRFPLRSSKRTKFLFVGGCIKRKGIDALLEAYLATFTRKDDVCLVVKPYGTHGVYSNQSLEADVRRAAAGSGAEIEVLDETLDAEELAALYRSCDALIHPYRGEGFGMTVAEAMASGLPVVVTKGGSCDDFCDDETGWMVRAHIVAIQSTEWTKSAAGAWWLEPSRAGIAEALRAIVAHPQEAARRGQRGRERIESSFTWTHVAAIAAKRIEALLSGTFEHTSASPRRSLEVVGG
jgi:glycosyltransferase involved in cell wall biosynthesis/tetratricopeptide (TPR) repeat protein